MDNILKRYIKCIAPIGPRLPWHILQPSHDGHAIAHAIAIVLEALATVCLGIFGHGAGSDGQALYALALAYGNTA